MNKRLEAFVSGLTPAQYRTWLRARNTLKPKVSIGCRWTPGSTPRMPALFKHHRPGVLARLITFITGK